MTQILVITVPTDAPAPNGAGAPVGTVMTTRVDMVHRLYMIWVNFSDQIMSFIINAKMS